MPLSRASRVRGQPHTVGLYYGPETDVTALLDCGVPMACVVVYVRGLRFESTGGVPQLVFRNRLWPGRGVHDLRRLRDAGSTVMVTLGGEQTGAFARFDACYGQLAAFLREFPWIDGVELDIAEGVGLENVCALIQRLADDFAGLLLAMAPVAAAMLGDGPAPPGGFSYAKLCARGEGRRIDWFNVQCHGCYDVTTFGTILAAEPPYPCKIVLCLLGAEFTPARLPAAMAALRGALHAHPTLRGAALDGDGTLTRAFALGTHAEFTSWLTGLWAGWDILKEVAGVAMVAGIPPLPFG